jgi:hypothetical protein
MAPEILADRSLSCRLERAEGLTNADFVEARARLTPESGARWISVAGAHWQCSMVLTRRGRKHLDLDYFRCPPLGS